MNEDVTIKLAGQIAFRVTEYELTFGIFEQPNTFECVIGRDYEFRRLAAAFPPKTPYQVFVGDALYQTGLIDGYTRQGSGKTEIKLHGRGILGRLADDEVQVEHSFRSPTYAKLVHEVLERSGTYKLMERFGIPTADALVTSNEANRALMTGKKAGKRKKNAPEVVEVIQEAVGGTEGAGTKRLYQYVRAEVGTKWWSFLTEQLRRAGFFLWEAVDGKIVLSTPNTEQIPIGRLVRTRDENNILDDSFSNDTRGRHSECTIYGRDSNGKDGTSKLEAKFVDDEMVAFLNPNPSDRADGGVIKLALTKRDSEVKSKEQAEALARREIAEERRAGWQLTYTIQGHGIDGIGTSEKARPAPDSIVEVYDDYLGIYGQMLIESGKLKGESGNTMTTLNLLRLEDCFFLLPTYKEPKLQKKGPNSDPIDTRVHIPRIAAFNSNLLPEYTTSGYSYPDPFEELAPNPDAGSAAPGTASVEPVGSWVSIDGEPDPFRVK